MKDENNSLIIMKFLALNPKVYSFKCVSVDEKYKDAHKDDIYERDYEEILANTYSKNKKTLKGVSKVVVKKEIKHEDYEQVLNTNKPINKTVTSIRSFNHQLFTYVQEKTALTSFYDKMKMTDKNTCVPFGYEN